MKPRMPPGAILPITTADGSAASETAMLSESSLAADWIRPEEDAAWTRELWSLMGLPTVNLDDLSPEEQLQLLEDIWDRLSQRPANLPLSPEQREELDRRLDAFEEDVRAGRPLGRPWSEVRERLRSDRMGHAEA